MNIRIYYEIWYNNIYFNTVYDTQGIIKAVCDIVNGYKVNPDDIQVKEYINGVLQRT